jgi:polar amino acid transport system permease protein
MPDLLMGTGITCMLTVVSMSIALVLWLVIALARYDRKRWYTYIPATCLVELFRGTPLLLQLFYLFYVLPDIGLRIPAIPTAIIGLSLNYGCYLSEVYRSGIEAIEKSQWEAAAALSLPMSITWRHIVLPPAVRIVIPALGNYFIGLFKDTSLVSTIAVTDLLFSGTLIAAQNFQYFGVFTAVALIYLAISLPASQGVRRLERHFRLESR